MQMLNKFFLNKILSKLEMNLETLNDHLVVKLNGPSIDLFDFELAFEHWYSKERYV